MSFQPGLKPLTRGGTEVEAINFNLAGIDEMKNEK